MGKKSRQRKNKKEEDDNNNKLTEEEKTEIRDKQKNDRQVSLAMEGKYREKENILNERTMVAEGSGGFAESLRNEIRHKERPYASRLTTKYETRKNKAAVEVEGLHHADIGAVDAFVDHLEMEDETLTNGQASDDFQDFDQNDDSAKVNELKKVLGEKTAKIDGLEMEIEVLKEEKAESEKEVRELERKLGVLEVKESEERSRRLRVEEEMKDKIGEKDKVISDLKKNVENLESVIANSGKEIEKLKSAEKAKNMELKDLIQENQEIKEELKKSTIQMEKVKSDEEEMKEKLGEMEKEMEQSDDDKKVLESIAARGLELETEVLRLQHDLISAMSEGQDVNVELGELKRVLGEKTAKIDVLEMGIEVLKKEKAESQKEVREL